MQKLNTDQRLDRIEENLVVIKRLLEQLLNKPATNSSLNSDNEIMSVKQVAKFLNLDANIIYAKCAKGEIPYFKIGKGYRFKKTDILKWVQGQKETSDISVDQFVDQYLQTHILKA
jgi:excisionase family DNA binding protein